MRIAAVVRDLPRNTGFGLVVENLLRGLIEEHSVRLFVVQSGYYKPHVFDPRNWPGEWEECTDALKNGSAEPGLSRASRYYRLETPRLAWLNAKIAEYHPDRVVGFDYNLSPYIGMLEFNGPRILNVVDSEIRYYENQILNGNVNQSALKNFVAAILTAREHFCRCTALVTVSPADTRNLRRWTGMKNVFTVPNGVDHNRYCPNPSIEKKVHRVAFCGSLSFPPNVQAVDWFVEKCWGRVLRQVPDAELLIIGKNPPTHLANRYRSQERVNVLGQVDDIRPHILSAAVSIAPMVSGTGIKNKILEAWAMAVPIVATHRAVEGLACDHRRNILVSGSAREFAANVVSLLKAPSLRDELGEAGRRHAIGRYSWTSSCQAFKNIIESAS